MIDNQEITEWHWAYYEQLYLFCKSDGYWIHCAKNKWPRNEEMEEFDLFLTGYSLKRGNVGAFLKKEESDNQKEFLQLCYKIFQPEWSNIEDAKDRWKLAISDISKLVKLKKGKGVDMKSATSKLFWFYHPEKLPMYDSQVSEALGKAITPDNFLERFFKYYEGVKEEVLKVHQYFGEAYISLPRVVDKYLWLLGQGKEEKEKIFKRFKSSFNQLPVAVKPNQ